jgi:hypothetical protein
MKGRNQAARWECGGFKAAHEARVPSLERVTHKTCRSARPMDGAGAPSISASISPRTHIPHGKHAFTLQHGVGFGRIIDIGLVRCSAVESVVFA